MWLTVVICYSFSLSTITIRYASQRHSKSLITGILYFLGFASELFGQFSFRLSSWVNPMNTA